MFTFYNEQLVSNMKEQMNINLKLHLTHSGVNFETNGHPGRMDHIVMKPHICNILPYDLNLAVCGKCLYNPEIESYLSQTLYPFCDCQLETGRCLFVRESSLFHNVNRDIRASLVRQYIKNVKTLINEKINLLEDYSMYVGDLGKFIDVVSLESYYRGRKITDLVQYTSEIHACMDECVVYISNKNPILS